MEEGRIQPLQESLSLRQKIGFSFGYGLNDLISAFAWTYILLFTELSLKLDTVYGGYIILVAQLTDAVSHPIAGVLSDRFGGCCHLGRRKSWYLFGFIFEAIGLFVAYGIDIPEDNNPDYIRFFYYVPGIICYSIAGAVVTVSHLAILVQITHSPLERVQLNGWRNAMTAVCSLIVYSTAWLLLYIDKGTNYKPQLSDSDAPAFRGMAAVVVGCGVLFSILFFILTKEDQKTSLHVATDVTSHSCQLTGVSKNNAEGQFLEISHPNFDKAMSLCKGYGAPKIRNENENQINSYLSSSTTDNASGTENGYVKNAVSQSNKIETSYLHNGVFSVMENDICLKSNEDIFEVAQKWKQNNSRITDVKTNNDIKNMRQSSWIKTIIKNPTFYKVTVIYCSCKLSVAVSQGYMPLYVTESLGMDKVSVAVMPLIIFVSGFIASLAMKKFNRRFGRLKTLLIGEFLTLGACIWIYFISQNVYQQIYGASMIFGTGLATIQVTVLAMIADLIGDDTAHGASMYGVIGFVEKIIQGLSFVLIQNFNPCRNGVSPECIQFYRRIIVAVPGATTLLSLIIIIVTEVMKKKANSENVPRKN